MNKSIHYTAEKEGPVVNTSEMSTCFKTEPPDTDDENSTVESESLNELNNIGMKIKTENQWTTLGNSSVPENINSSNEEYEMNDSQHYKVEGMTTKYSCGICDFLSDTFLEMREHRKLHYIEKRTCAMCGMVCQSVVPEEVPKVGTKDTKLGNINKEYTCSPH